jgi:hypothetical protein
MWRVLYRGAASRLRTWVAERLPAERPRPKARRSSSARGSWPRRGRRARRRLHDRTRVDPGGSGESRRLHALDGDPLEPSGPFLWQPKQRSGPKGVMGLPHRSQKMQPFNSSGILRFHWLGEDLRLLKARADGPGGPPGPRGERSGVGPINLLLHGTVRAVRWALGVHLPSPPVSNTFTIPRYFILTHRGLPAGPVRIRQHPAFRMEA